MEKEIIAMSRQERDVLKVMSLVLEGKRMQAEAGRLLSPSVRQVRRVQRRLERKACFGEIFQHFSHNIAKVVSMPSSENPNERPEKLSYEEQSSSSRYDDRIFNFGCLIVVVIIVIGIGIFIAISWRSGDLVPLQK